MKSRVAAAVTLFGITFSACRQQATMTGSRDSADVAALKSSAFSQSELPAISVTASSGRRVSLFDVRAAKFQSAVLVSLDELPCPYFKQGSDFEIKMIAGGPPIPIPGPIQNHYAGAWAGDNQYQFRVSLWNRIYHDDNIADWALEQPAALASQYVPKLFDFVVTNPKSTGCLLTAKRLN